jgi:hypothetical protein
MREPDLLKLEEVCRAANVRLMVVRAYGLFGTLRVNNPVSPSFRSLYLLFVVEMCTSAVSSFAVLLVMCIVRSLVTRLSMLFCDVACA